MTIAERKKLRYTGSIDCMWKVFRTEGLRGISKGMCVTLVREIPATGVYFYSYDELCKLGPRSETRNEAMPVTVLIAGGIAGILSWVVTYPCDVIKSRFQADLDGIYTSSTDCAIKSYRAEGWRMFFQGMNSTIIRAFPANAATFGAVVLFARLVYGEDNDMW
jgi:solute carrier family 25 carnitine/acylcarnitine transporter 20/29